MTQSRRDFLKRTGCAALSSAAFAAGLAKFSEVNTLAQTGVADYKALVCIFLDGGNDGNNMIIPYDDYAPYQTARGSSGLAVLKDDLVQITPMSTGGRKFGLNPRMAVDLTTTSTIKSIDDLWAAQKLAVLCNVGTLLAPLTKDLYRTKPDLRPFQIGSHSDQQDQHMSTVSNGIPVTGWGGRIADSMSTVNNGPSGPPPLPMVISTNGSAMFGAGATIRPLAVASAPTALNQILVLNMTATGTATQQTTERQARGLAFDKIRAEFDGQYLTKAYNETTANSLLASTALSTSPTLTTTFPGTGLGNQLLQIAKLMKANQTQATLGLKRQIFFARIGGFDTHSNQRNGGQDALLQQVAQAMTAFYNATVELGLADKVTTFTMSDFGRTLDPAGSGTNVGSDHAWGNHQLIMGGAVRGGDFYGTFPTLTLAGPDDTDNRGRWIPTTSIEQYAATLARWYGLPDAEIPKVFPLIGRFATSNLGFMG